MPTTLDRKLTIPQTAEALGVSDTTIRNWIAQGKLRAYRYGPRLIRIEAKDLEALREQIAPATYAHVSGGDR